MRSWRLALAGYWAIVVGLPLAAIAAELVRHPSNWLVWQEYGRLIALSRNTLLLVAGTLLVAVPAGAVIALFLTRSDLPLRNGFRRLVVLALFIPLPVQASAWQSALGSGGWLPATSWRTVEPTDPDFSPTGISWKPWATGLPAAIWIHALAGLPWVIWLTGQGFSWVECNLEEDALLNGGIWSALRHVALPRATPTLGAATLWLTIQVSCDISVTDMMQVRTFAEEVYTQFARPDPAGPNGGDAMGRALAASVLPSLFLGLLAGWAYRRWQYRLPPLADLPTTKPLLRLGLGRWPGAFVLIAIFALLLGIPTVSLIWKMGHLPPGNDWSPARAWQALHWAVATQYRLIGSSLVWSALGAMIITLSALLMCWFARDHWRFRIGIFATLILSATLPGPILGIGLKETINLLMDMEDIVSGGHLRIVQAMLYNGPSPVPVMWASLLRFLPVAVALLWPAVRALPRELHDAARTDGAGPWSEFQHTGLRPLSRVCALVTLAVTALSLGELSAGKLVETPGGQTFAHEVFMQMHYGVGNHLAAMCLLLVAVVAVPLWLLDLVSRISGNRQPEY